jgi:DinB superfamily
VVPEARDRLIPFLYQSWDDLDHAVHGLTAAEAADYASNRSSICWTDGHVTQMLDSWLNARFQGREPHPLVAAADFRTGGSGQPVDGQRMQGAVRDVRAAARSFLESAAARDLDQIVTYDGSISFLRPIGLSLRYAVMRIAAHHFTHVGEILTIRAEIGHRVDDQLGWGSTWA